MCYGRKRRLGGRWGGGPFQQSQGEEKDTGGGKEQEGTWQMREGTWQNQIRLLTGTEWLAREVLKVILWEVADCVEAMDIVRDLREWEQTAVYQVPAGPSKRRTSWMSWTILPSQPQRRHQVLPREGGWKQFKKTVFHQRTVLKLQDCDSSSGVLQDPCLLIRRGHTSWRGS